MEGVELHVETESPGLSVPQELALDRQPGLARRAARCPDNVLKVQGECPEDTGQGNAVEAQPSRGPSSGRHVDEDVVIQGVAPEGEEDQVLPTAVGGRGRVKDDGD